MNRKTMLLIGVLIFHHFAFSQKRVSITIDDVPNTVQYEKDGYQSNLLELLDSLAIPVAIFINEGFIYHTDGVVKNFELLANWARKPYITLGNHSFSHARYSAVGMDSFANEIIQGESISRQLAAMHKKTIRHFRFPYNDLGRDSLQHMQVRRFLEEKRYTVAPFTIESSDWMYNAVYEYYLDRKKFEKAKEIGNEYLAKTLAYFNFFENLAQENYKRAINQIYLCHDNKLNADFLPKVITALKRRGYHFVSLEEALTDDVYAQQDHYFQKWGISWLYRWMVSQKERIAKMKQEPSMEKITEQYNQISN